MYVITPNYKDRSNLEKPWLVRHHNEPLASTIAVSSVAAKGLLFQQSGEEAGFGCSVIALANEIELEPVTEQEIRNTLPDTGIIKYRNSQIESIYHDAVKFRPFCLFAANQKSYSAMETPKGLYLTSPDLTKKSELVSEPVAENAD